MSSRPSLTLARCAGGCSSSAKLKRCQQTKQYFCVNCLWKKNVTAALSFGIGREPESPQVEKMMNNSRESLGKRKLESDSEGCNVSQLRTSRPTLRRSVSFADNQGRLLAEVMRGMTPCQSPFTCLEECGVANTPTPRVSPGTVRAR